MSRLIVKNLSKYYGLVAAIDDVSFTVNAGEFVSLLGPSGCGKTTTLRCIAGFERPDTGLIAFDDEPMTDPAASVFVPPNKRKFDGVSILRGVAAHDGLRQRCLSVAHRGHISRDGDPPPRHRAARGGQPDGLRKALSDPAFRRPAAARSAGRALVLQPRARCCSTSRSAISMQLRERMRFELVEIQSRLGIPAVYVTHDQSEAMVMSDRVIVMSGGRIAQEGPPRRSYAAPVALRRRFHRHEQFRRRNRNGGGRGWPLDGELPARCA